MAYDHSEYPNYPIHQIPAGVQVLSTILFGAFAIVTVVLAFSAFWLAGVALAVILAWRGGFAPRPAARIDADAIAEQLRKLSPEAEARRSGNSSFDAYRTDVLQRLEQEQDQFDTFLGRLRDAKDAAEFDRFMDDRASRAVQVEQAS